MAPPSQPGRRQPHGQKLYVLFAGDAGANLKESRPDRYKSKSKPPTSEVTPAEQVLIKHSWTDRPEPGRPAFIRNSSGRVKSRMACHETAGDGRLFGLPKAK